MRSLVHLNRPSKKAVHIPADAGYEQVEMLISKLETVFINIFEGAPVEELLDVDFVRDALNNMFDKDEFQDLFDEDYGQGYMMGFLAGMIAEQIENEN